MIHCFYHSSDLDGHCSGAIVKYKYPDAVMHPINYGDEFPWEEILPDDEVYMVDFCLQPFADMKRLSESCFLTWIDHHKTAIDQRGLMLHWTGNVNTGKAACELSWEWLFPDKPVPLAVKLLSLYDSWTYQGHELEDMVLPFQMRMRLEELDPKDYRNAICWRGLFENDFLPIFDCPSIDQLVEEGRLLLRYDEKMKADYAKTYAFETELKQYCPDCGEHFVTSSQWFCKHFPKLKAIAVNLGHTNSKVFDSVWRRECSRCEGTGNNDNRDSTDESLCSRCKGSGYIEPYDIMIAFCRRKDKLWNVSLYSTKENIDCGAIAKSFGGGGHKGAAGFQCSNLPFEF